MAEEDRSIGIAGSHPLQSNFTLERAGRNTSLDVMEGNDPRSIPSHREIWIVLFFGLH
jgi:hypothetical protein